LVDVPASEFYVDFSEHSVCSFLDGVSRKSSQDEIVGVFIWEKVCLENRRGKAGGGGGGGGGSKLRNRLWRTRTPNGGHNKYVREKQSCVEVRKGSHEME
jgi:hypothetical protein